MLIAGKHLGPLQMLPAAPGKCPKCAGEHAPEMPHVAEGLFYQYWFYNQHGRWPDWMDALEHCELDMQLLWLFELEILGVNVEAGDLRPRNARTGG